MSDLNRAKRWRARAEELRTIADDARTEDAQTLLYFATDLDAMAERLEHPPER